jgi:hypothetical protein
MNEKNAGGAASGGEQITQALTGLGFTPVTLARALDIGYNKAYSLMNNGNATLRDAATLARLVCENTTALLYCGAASIWPTKSRERPAAASGETGPDVALLPAISIDEARRRSAKTREEATE